MKRYVGLWSNNTIFSSVELFSAEKTKIFDDLRLPFLRLKEAFAFNGLELCIADEDNVNTLESFIFVNMPERDNIFFRYAVKNDKKRYLIIWENYIWDKGNVQFDRYEDFTCVFTYDDEIVRKGLAVKLNYAFDLPFNIIVSDENKNKLVCMILRNYRKNKYNSTYFKRLQAIKFFEKNNIAEFDFYGFGWEGGSDLFQDVPVVHRIIKRLGITKILPRVKHSSWRGTVEGKRDVLSKYKFAYCYENTEKISGYITEKIFDVMMAGTVPIYLGHPSTRDYIPKNCFINRSDFTNERETYEFISSMTKDVYLGYLEAIALFLSGKQSFDFSIDNFVEKLSGEIYKNF